MPQVQRIDPIVLPSEKESVAAYCRVSTDSADQLNSYHSQIAYYTKLRMARREQKIWSKLGVEHGYHQSTNQHLRGQCLLGVSHER